MLHTYSGMALLGLASGCVLAVLAAAILAMLGGCHSCGDGTIKLDFNGHGEGWWEIGGLALILAACWWRIIRFVRGK